MIRGRDKMIVKYLIYNILIKDNIFNKRTILKIR